MPRYYFDTRDDQTFMEDEMGLEFPDLESVKVEAARSLAELARDVIPGAFQRELAVQVRDELGPVLKVLMTFQAIILRPASNSVAEA
jgi:hypothetical protein